MSSSKARNTSTLFKDVGFSTNKYMFTTNTHSAMVFTALALAGALACAREEFINAYHDYGFYEHTALPFKADYFSEVPGALVCATKERGEEALVRAARHQANEQYWAFFPEHELWLNFGWEATTHSVRAHPQLERIAETFAACRTNVHTHPGDWFDNSFPSDIDLATALAHERSCVKDAVASSRGVRYYQALPGAARFGNDFVKKARENIRRPWMNQERVLKTSFNHY